ncbi:zinc finger CCCH domain-containing protein 39-like [Hordeum vulgare]|uniref:C3H1-type domain-containing protein n=2 Tax=Hordeum vulgare subsp. vulgare TaxID=112509 RepID=A0A8I6WZL6_HORVV|nr:zinc finger CCCH domain-containing protein 39-like [Hordeum vulgare]
MQEAPLVPAHPVPFGFWPRPVCFFYAGCTPFVPCPSPSPLGSPVVPIPTPSPRGTTFVPIPGPSPLGSPFIANPGPSPRATTFAPSPRPSPRATPVTPCTRTSSRGSPFTPSPRAQPGGTPWSSSSSSGSRVDDAAATEHRLRLARLALQYQDATNRYELCLSHLADAAREAAALRLENSELRVANNDLAGRFAMLGGNQASAVALAGQLRGVHLGQMQVQVPAVASPPVLPMPMARPRPASPAEKHTVMPKSISIRSTGYLKMAKDGKHRVTKPMDVGSQRMFVGVDVGGAKAEEHKGGTDGGEKRAHVVKSAAGLEFEVYSQGMYKTELCNKWEETGACLYGDQCQFAHGIAELRPIIRHPRYKTQVCRMVIGGGLCPYGHRCHFRHSITPADNIPLLYP